MVFRRIAFAWAIFLAISKRRLESHKSLAVDSDL